ncbi:MAG: hypothetical protein ABI818_07460, partial [Acidobacteriota bacterium]
ASAETRQLSNQLDQTRAIRDRLAQLEQQIRDAEARQPGASPGAGRGHSGSSPSDQSPGSPQQSRPGQPGQPGSSAESAPDGRPGNPGGGGSGQQTGSRSGRGGTSGAGGSGGDLQRLRDEYQRELQRAQEALGRLGSGGAGGGAPEQEQFSRSAPGTEAFKQDRSDWDALRKDIDIALEKHEAAVSDRLARKRAEDRFSAGGSDRVPDGYRRSVAKYFESLARDKD